MGEDDIKQSVTFQPLDRASLTDVIARITQLQVELSSHLAKDEVYQSRLELILAGINADLKLLVKTYDTARGWIRGLLFAGLLLGALFTDVGQRILSTIHKLAGVGSGG